LNCKVEEKACVAHIHKKMGKDYIRFGSSAIELGADLKRECYFILPSGEMRLEELLKFYH